MHRPLRIFLALSLPIVLADQISKAWIRGNLAVGESIPVVDGLFRIWHRTNDGGAFSVLGDQAWGMPVLIAVSSLAVLAMAVFAWRLDAHDRRSAIALGLMAGGAAGNLLDRVRFAEVTDFLDLYREHGALRGLLDVIAGGPHFPTFNLADMGIVCGGLALALLTLRAPPGSDQDPGTDLE